MSEHAVDGIVVTSIAGNESVWVSHTRYIYFLRPENLSQEGFLYRDHMDGYVGCLSMSPTDQSTVWSAHLGGQIMSAWDVARKSHKINIDTAMHLKDIDQNIPEYDRVITAISPALVTSLSSESKTFLPGTIHMRATFDSSQPSLVLDPVRRKSVWWSLEPRISGALFPLSIE